MGNGFFIKDPLSFNDNFIYTLADKYNAAVSKVDKHFIMDWVEKETHGKIKFGSEYLDEYVKSYALTSLYFKPFWDLGFTPDKSYHQNFKGRFDPYLSSHNNFNQVKDGIEYRNEADVRFMSSSDKFLFWEDRSDATKYLKMDCLRNDAHAYASVIFILPQDSNNIFLKNLE